MWLGSAFDCAESQNEIILQHHNFDRGTSAISQCNAGAIYAHDFHVQDSYYTSHLTIMFSISLDGQNVRCVYASGTESTGIPVGISILTRTRGIV